MQIENLENQNPSIYLGLQVRQRERIWGLDVARCIAVIGMIMVHYHASMETSDDAVSILERIILFIHGKAAATFVMIAGIGISMMARSALSSKDPADFLRLRIRLFKRSLFLFVLGLLFWTEWDADILHYYGVYFTLAAFSLRLSDRALFLSSFLFPVLFVLLWAKFDYNYSWSWENLAYLDFWTPMGFLRNLFFNGWHPVVPWMGFVTFGMWLGRRDLADKEFLTKCFCWGLTFTIGLTVLSRVLFNNVLLPGLDEAQAIAIFGTESEPPLPLYIFTAGGFGLAVISGSILLARKYPASLLIKGSAVMGQMALSLYLAHIIIGLETLEYLGELNEPKTVFYAVMCAMNFFFLSVIGAVLWRTRFSRGPVEYLMHKLTN